MNSVVMRSDVDTRGTLLLPYIIVWLIGACSLAAVVIFVNVACSRSAAVERRNAVLAVSLVITILYAMWSAFMIRYVLTPLHDEISEAYAQLCAFFSHVESLELDKAPVYAASSMKHKEEVTYVDEYGALLVVPFSVRPELQDVQAEASLATLKLREYCSYLPHDYVGVDHAASLQPHDGDRDAVDNDHSSLPPLPPPERCRRRRSWRHRHGPTLQRRSATVLAVLSAAPDAAIDDATASAAMNALFDAAARYDGKVTQCSLSGSLVSWNTCRRRQPNHEALGFQCGLQIVESMRRLGTTVVVAGATSDETLSGIMDARDDSHYTVVYGDSVVLAKAAASLAIACNTSAKDMPLRYIWASPNNNNNNNNNNSSSNFPKQVDYSFVPFASMQTSAFGGPTAVLFSVNPRSSIGAVVDDDAPVLTAMRHAFDLFSNGHYAAASDVYGTAVSAAVAGTDLSKVAKWLCDLSACYAQQQQQHGGAASSSGAALVVPPHWQSFGEAPCTRQAHGGECVVGHSGGGGSCKAHAACLEAQLQRELTTMSDAAAPDEEEAEEDKASAAAVMPSSTTLSLPSAVAAVHYEDFCDSDGAHFRLSFRRLGKSAVSPVFLGLCCATGVLVAVKALNLSGSEKRMTDQRRRRLRRKNILILTEQSVDQIVSEVKVMSALQHECIVGYVSAALHGRRLLLVMEYVCGGSLYTVMNAYRLSVPQARQYLRDVLRGLKYLHSKGILHCDVKPQNVLVGDAGCKLADFGVARSLRLSTCDGGGASSPSPFAHGTPEYMSPESTVGRATDRSDVWSFGIMLAHVITGELPWPAGTPRTSLMVNLARGAISPALRRPMPPEADGAEEVFRCCTRMAPAERPSIAEVLRMPFFSTPPRH